MAERRKNFAWVYFMSDGLVEQTWTPEVSAILAAKAYLVIKNVPGSETDVPHADIVKRRFSKQPINLNELH